MYRFLAMFMNITLFWGATLSGLVSVSSGAFFLEHPEYWAAGVFETLINRPIYNSTQSVNGEEGYRQVVSCKMKIAVVGTQSSERATNV
jgi:hypothetical protein